MDLNLYQSDRLVYRAYDAAKDNDFYLSMHADPSVYHNTWKGLPQPVNQNRIDYIVKLLNDSLLFVVICLNRNTDTSVTMEPVPIGILSIKSVIPTLAHNRSAELGIEFKRDAQGQGYGSEALRWALKWAFHTANLHRVQLEAYEWNKAALHTYEKVGFTVEGKLRQAVWRDGRWWDEIVLGILVDEWKATLA